MSSERLLAAMAREEIDSTGEASISREELTERLQERVERLPEEQRDAALMQTCASVIRTELSKRTKQIAKVAAAAVQSDMFAAVLADSARIKTEDGEFIAVSYSRPEHWRQHMARMRENIDKQEAAFDLVATCENMLSPVQEAQGMTWGEAFAFLNLADAAE